ncbi:MAG: 2-dehydropantoate 2-reductase [Deltaproteobacteria bacterium]|nr:2-dehydropantoate 2-reductase [Deltaproteobacteria bacterium]
MRIAVLGAGSMGTIAGALMTKSGYDVTLIDANKAHVTAMNEKGASITGTMDLNVPVTAVTPDQMEETYDIVFYLVKQTSNEAALSALLPHLHDDSIVCTLQNGIPEGIVADYVGSKHVMGCAVGWGATWLGPGVSELTSDTAKMTFDLGELDGSVKERTKRVAAILESICPVSITENLRGTRWTKLLVNATMSGMSVSLGCTFGDVLDNEKALTCVAHIGNEALNVAGKLGITMEPIQGVDVSSLAFKTREERAGKLALFEAVFRPHAFLKASMFQDIEKGQKTEVGAINGVISQKGKETAIPTPLNDTVVDLVRGMEEGKYSPVFDNLAMFEIPPVPEA